MLRDVWLRLWLSSCFHAVSLSRGVRFGASHACSSYAGDDEASHSTAMSRRLAVYRHHEDHLISPVPLNASNCDNSRCECTKADADTTDPGPLLELDHPQSSPSWHLPWRELGRKQQRQAACKTTSRRMPQLVSSAWPRRALCHHNPSIIHLFADYAQPHRSLDQNQTSIA